MLHLQILVIIAHIISVQMLQGELQNLENVEVGVHSPVVTLQNLIMNAQFTINFNQAYHTTPGVRVWFTEISEQGSGVYTVRCSTTPLQILFTSFTYKVYFENTNFNRLSVQWIASTLKQTDLTILNFPVKSTTTTIEWPALTFSEPPQVLFFFAGFESETTKNIQLTKTPLSITAQSMTIDPVIDDITFGAYATILAFSSSRLQTISGYLKIDIYTQNHWITIAGSTQKTFNYPVDNNDTILRGIYAFNNNQSPNFNAKISVNFAKGETQGLLEYTIPTAQALPIDGFKFMAAQIAYLRCPLNSVAPQCNCVEGFYEDSATCKCVIFNIIIECPLTCKRCVSEKSCQECQTGMFLAPSGLCLCLPGYFLDSTKCSSTDLYYFQGANHIAKIVHQLRHASCAIVAISQIFNIRNSAVNHALLDVLLVLMRRSVQSVLKNCIGSYLTLPALANQDILISVYLAKVSIPKLIYIQNAVKAAPYALPQSFANCVYIKKIGRSFNNLANVLTVILKTRIIYANVQNDINNEECSLSCLQCQDDLSCHTCDPNMNRLLADTKCICKLGFYEQNIDTICTSTSNIVKLECQTPCSSCLSNTSCLGCIDVNKNLQNGICACNLGFFQVDGLCQKCISRCHDCESANGCISCGQNSNRDIINNCECSYGFLEERDQCVKESEESQVQSELSKDISIGSEKIITTECGQGCLECETSNKCSSCDKLQHLHLSDLGVCICDDTFVEIDGICQSCQYPCLLCSKSPYNCTTCDTYHTLNSLHQCTCQPPLVENINLRKCEVDQTIDSTIIAAFESINKRLKGNTSVAITINLAIPIGIYGLLTNSPQFLLSDLFIKPIHPLKVYKSFETLSRFVFPIYLPEIQGSHQGTSLILFGSYNATQQAYQYGRPLNETYMNTLGFSPYSVITCSQHFIVLFFIGLSWLLASILTRNNIQQRIMAKLYDLNYALLHLAIESGILFLAVSSLYTLVAISKYQNIKVLPLFIISVVTSLLLIVSFICYLLYVIYQIIISHKRNEESMLLKRFPFFFYQVSTQRLASSMFRVTSSLKKLFSALIVVCFSTRVGYILLIILQSLFTIYILLAKPQQFRSNFLLDICLQAVYIVFLALSLNDYLQIDQNPSGDGTFCFIICVLFINLMGTFGKVIAGYEFKKFKKMASQNQQQEEQNEEAITMVIQQF